MEFFLIATRNLVKRQKRSWLTMIGIFIGIAAVVALISLSQGLQDAVNGEFEKLGMNKVIISPGGSIFGAGGADVLSDDDMDVIHRVRGVDEVGAMIMSTALSEWGDERWYVMVAGYPTDPGEFDAVVGLDYVTEGRPFRDGEENVAIVGYDYLHGDVFQDHVALGDRISVNGRDFRIVGALDRTGNPSDDRSVILPLETARDVLDVPERVDAYMVLVQDGQDPQEVADRIEQAMRKDRGQKEGQEDFGVQTFKDLLQSFLVILNIITTLLVGIAGISLLVGGIGIMNTMYTAVLERTKEIGVMKAIGARNSDVLTIFLIESGLLGMAGGAIGILIGAALSLTAAYLAQVLGGFDLLKASFPLWLILGALLFSFIVGVLSGILPARQAARKNPVDSLRYE
jgi:putative ABC transport system permease protein